MKTTVNEIWKQTTHPRVLPNPSYNPFFQGRGAEDKPLEELSSAGYEIECTDGTTRVYAASDCGFITGYCSINTGVEGVIVRQKNSNDYDGGKIRNFRLGANVDKYGYEQA